MKFRVGQGIDIHPLVEGRPCILGGVRIESPIGPEGHSDADVIIHAVIDAILGATGNEDIGALFPDSDAAFKNADSMKLLRTAWGPLYDKGWRIQNLDITVLLEAPKLRPHVSKMREGIALVLNCEPEDVTVKATTAEKLGYVGRGEGVYASAVVLLGQLDR